MINHEKLFKNSRETALTKCKISGEIPKWLTGSLYRIGPGLFNLKKQKVNHWFDGMGLLHHFKIENSTAFYQSKFIESSAYKKAKKNQQLCYREFATDPCSRIFKHFFTKFTQKFTSNTLVNLTKVDNQMVSMTETPQPIIFDPKSLKTNGPLKFDDQYTYNLSTAHPHLDPNDQSIINLGIRMGLKTTYEFFKIIKKKRVVISSVKVDQPSYQHSFGMTKNYLIIVDIPYKVSPLKLIFGNKTYIEQFKWTEKDPTLFHIIDIKTGKKVCSIKGPSLFMFHQVNAFEKNNKIIFDTIAYENPDVINALYLDNLRSKKPKIPPSHLKRFILDIQNKRCIENKILCEETLELPNINYKKNNTKDYRYVYGLNINKSTFFNRVLKVDIKSKDYKYYEKKHCIPSEPVFIQNPHSNDEDDGIILSVFFNTKEEQTELHGINAKTMRNEFSAIIPQLNGFTFHGQFYEGE